MYYKWETRTDIYKRNQYVWKNKNRADKRAQLAKLKSERGCSQCPENHPACLHFHHTDIASKKNSVNKLVSQDRSWKVISEEMEKCIILCANCHAKLHWKHNANGNQYIDEV